MCPDEGGISKDQAVAHLDSKLLPFLFRAGLLLVQINCRSSRPSHRIFPLILRHACELCLATLAYGLDDYILAYGERTCQLIGINCSQTSPQNRTVTGWSAIVTATGLFNVMTNGRMHILGFMIVVVIMAVFIDPVMINCMQPNKIALHSDNVHDVFKSYKNVGGRALTHICAGFVAFIALVFIGRGRFHKRDLKGPLGSALASFIGYWLLLLGFIALCMPNISHSPTQTVEELKRIALKNIAMAITGGISVVFVMVVLVEKASFKRRSMLRCMKGAIAGMVMISACADVLAPPIAMFWGMVGGAFYYFVARKIFRTLFEEMEYCNMIPVHLFCGLISTLIAPSFVDDSESVRNEGDATWRMARQVFYDINLLASLFIIFAVICYVLHCFGYIRNDENKFQSFWRQQIKMKNEIPIRFAVGGSEEGENLSPEELREKQKAYLRHFNPKLAEQERI